MTRRRLIVALLALVAAAGALTAHLATRSEPASVRPEVSADGIYRPGSLPNAAAQDAVEAAVLAAQKALSYDYRTLDEGLADATALMTADFRDEFREAFEATARSSALEKKAVTRTLVRGGGLVRLEDDDHAVTMVFVDQVLVDSTTMNNKEQPLTVSQNRVLVSLELKDDKWLVSSIEPF